MTIENWKNTVELAITPPELDNPIRKVFEVRVNDFDPTIANKKNRGSRYLIIGFDTEFKTPNHWLNRDEILAGEGKYKVVSYQFHCITPEGIEWNGICCPDKGERLTLNEFVIFALGDGARNHSITNIPTTIYLVGHFTRADIPAFADFKSLQNYLSNVRSTFITIDSGKQIHLDFPETNPISLKLMFRDTMLLTPQTSKSLSGIGELVGVPKLRLGNSEKEHRALIENMDKTINTHWDSFRAYAIQDASICAKYMLSICKLYEEVTGERKVPITLSSIGVRLLQNKWKSVSKTAEHEYLGIIEHQSKQYDKSKGRYNFCKKRTPIEEVFHNTTFATETYHGGRNEQFWFGPCFEDNWSDFDLTSAYPTAMSIIGKPVWTELFHTKNVDDFKPDTLGYCWVEFEFPPDTRYPTLPVRSANGLLFPLKGISCCASPEIVLAKSLGASLKIKEGLIVPTDQSTKIFGDFILDCINQRKKSGSKTLKGLFWKEISNSTYGKTAQGLKEKRIYDMRDMNVKPLPPSIITNAFFASYITSFVRAVLGEIMNSLPTSRMVFSCTTDGFLTNATEAEVMAASNGQIMNLFKLARKSLVGTEDSLEIKHKIRQPLGWRTRGQATLIKGENPDEDFSIVLAKGGIYTPAEYDTDSLQNLLITKMFFDRFPGQTMNFGILTGVKDIIENDTDVVKKAVTKRIGMEFDWKRTPASVGFSTLHNHILFNTRPWENLEQFESIRNTWENYTKTQKKNIKSLDDYRKFSTFVEVSSMSEKGPGKYISKDNGDIKRLRQLLCSAWKQSKAGLSWTDSYEVTAEIFASILTKSGIPCKRTDVENGKKRVFIERSCPPTTVAIEALNNLKREFPKLDIDVFLFKDIDPNAVYLTLSNDCPFVAKCT